jgi:hypothetical protein
MTSTIGKAATAKTLERLAGAKGVQSALAALSLAEVGRTRVVETVHLRAQNVASELAEKAGLVKYPAANVYCHKVVNDFKEKFRTFSGRVWMGIEVRHSQDRLEGIETHLQLYIDAVCTVIESTRGDWGDGMYYAGGYEVTFAPTRHGGKNFIQAATVAFAVEVGR